MFETVTSACIDVFPKQLTKRRTYVNIGTGVFMFLIGIPFTCRVSVDYWCRSMIPYSTSNHMFFCLHKWEHHHCGRASWEDWDQIKHQLYLVSVFAVRMPKDWVLSYPYPLFSCYRQFSSTSTFLNTWAPTRNIFIKNVLVTSAKKITLNWQKAFAVEVLKSK